MHTGLEHAHRSPHKSITVCIADNPRQIRQAQALRYQIFAEEMHANLNCKEPGFDQDLFDPYCDHLIAIDENNGQVIGTYRILAPHQAQRIGSYYSDTEFDLTRLNNIRSNIVELGRSCVHPDYRTGTTIALLWNALNQYMEKNRYQYMMGCASVTLKDGGHTACSLYDKLAKQALSPIEWRVFPRTPLPIKELNSTLQVEIPALIKGYIRAGAMLCGEPAWDPYFNTADFLLLLPRQHISRRYAKHFGR
ncbi:GNAT family N-acetyltransferase [Chitinibacter sp. SCUT-21]|uniref:GNAT family N-acetyltransferase n=1 Tax=Chitinibacter sp. SCUT-21 TaxID=2970891 RepID=UPI0035A6079A